MPSGCDPSKKKECKFAVWDYADNFAPGWCQLSTDECVIKAKDNAVLAKVEDNRKFKSNQIKSNFFFLEHDYTYYNIM